MELQTALTEPRLLLTPEQAAQTLGLGRSSVYELMRARRIRSVKIGRSRRIPYASLLDFVSQLEHGETSAAVTSGGTLTATDRQCVRASSPGRTDWESVEEIYQAWGGGPVGAVSMTTVGRATRMLERG